MTERVRAVVVDDEPSAREAITTLLANDSRVEVVGEASNGVEAVAVVRRTRPDLLFLDIQMPDAHGFAVLDTLGEEVPRGVVFVTAHDEHAVRAFEVHALDYVLKPFGRPRFEAAVARALERLRALDALTLQRTLESIARDRAVSANAGAVESANDLPIASSIESPESGTPARTPPRRIGVRNNGKISIVDTDAIDWVEAVGDYARIHSGRQAHLVFQRMHALERLLDGGDFIRVHRSLIVNLRRVRELVRESDGGGTLVLETGVRLRVARGRWEALQGALGVEEL
jgi:two-component system LytT family response regulator